MAKKTDGSTDGKAGGWTRIPNDVIDRIPEIGLTAFAAYAILCRMTDRNGQCFPKEETIAKRLGSCTRTARRAIHELEEVDPPLIEAERRRDHAQRQISNLYTLSRGTPVSPGNAEPEDTSVPLPEDKFVQEPEDTSVPQTRPIREQDPIEQEPPYPPKGDGAVSESNGKVAVADIIAHYQTYHPQARPGDKERKLIRGRLKDYTADQIKAAIDGCHKSPHHCGQNDRHTKFQSLGLICRDNDHVQMFLEISQEAESNGSAHDEEGLVFEKSDL